MTSEAIGLSRAGRALDMVRDRLESRRNQAIAALVLYSAIGIGYFGLHTLSHFGRECVCEPGPSDSSIFMWGLAWWPHALLHGINPFFTNALFAPDRLALGGDVTIPLAALVTAPITLLFGPVASYNLLMLASPVLAAFFAFLLCRYITRHFAASLVGGYLFGFSAYMLGHLLGPSPSGARISYSSGGSSHPARDRREDRKTAVHRPACAVRHDPHPHLDGDCPYVRDYRSRDARRCVRTRTR